MIKIQNKLMIFKKLKMSFAGLHFVPAKNSKLKIDLIWLFILILLSPFFLFPDKFYYIILIIPLILGLRLFESKEIFQKTSLDIPILIILFQVFINLIINDRAILSWTKTIVLVFSVLFYYAIVQIMKNRKMLYLSIWVLAGFGFILGLGSLILSSIGQSSKFSQLSIIKKFLPTIKLSLPGAEEGINSNAIAGVLVILLPLAVLIGYEMILNVKKKIFFIKKIWLLIIGFLWTLISILGLMFTQSRGAYLGIVFGLLVLGWWIGQRKKISYMILILYLQIILFFGGMIYFVLKGESLNRSIKEELTKTYKVRDRLWKIGIKEAYKNPFFGKGLNQLRYHPDMTYNLSHAHNQFIHTAAELGLPGLIAYILVLFQVFKMCLAIIKSKKHKKIRYFAYALFLGQMAHIVYGLTDAIPLGAKAGIIWWLSLSIITGLYNYNMVFNREIGENEIK